MSFFSKWISRYHLVGEELLAQERTALLIRLPKKLHRRFRVYAAKHGVPMSRLVERVVSELLTHQTHNEIIGEVRRKRAQERVVFKKLQRRRHE